MEDSKARTVYRPSLKFIDGGPRQAVSLHYRKDQPLSAVFSTEITHNRKRGGDPSKTSLKSSVHLIREALCHGAISNPRRDLLERMETQVTQKEFQSKFDHAVLQSIQLAKATESATTNASRNSVAHNNVKKTNSSTLSHPSVKVSEDQTCIDPQRQMHMVPDPLKDFSRIQKKNHFVTNEYSDYSFTEPNQYQCDMSKSVRKKMGDNESSAGAACTFVKKRILENEDGLNQTERMLKRHRTSNQMNLIHGKNHVISSLQLGSLDLAWSPFSQECRSTCMTNSPSKKVGVECSKDSVEDERSMDPLYIADQLMFPAGRNTPIPQQEAMTPGIPIDCCRTTIPTKAAAVAATTQTAQVLLPREMQNLLIILSSQVVPTEFKYIG